MLFVAFPCSFCVCWLLLFLFFFVALVFFFVFVFLFFFSLFFFGVLEPSWFWCFEILNQLE